MTESVQESAAKMGIDWLKGQPFQNVMSVLLLAAICLCGYAVIYDLIPSERQAIELLIDRQEDRHTKQIERIADSFDKVLDRQWKPSSVAGK